MYHLGRGAARSDILSSSCLPDLDDGAGLDIPVFLWKGSFLKKKAIWGFFGPVWESATPPTHIWERSPKKKFFYSFPHCQTVFSGIGISLLWTKMASRRNKIYLWVSICHLIFRFLLHPSIHDFASTFKVDIMKSFNFSSKGCIEFTRLWSVL